MPPNGRRIGARAWPARASLRPAVTSVRFHACGWMELPAAGGWRSGGEAPGPRASKTGPTAGAPGRRDDGACPARRRQLPPVRDAGLTRWRPGWLDGWRRDRGTLTAWWRRIPGPDRHRGSPRHLARSRMPAGHRGAPPYRKRRSPVTATQRPSRRKPVEGVAANRFRPCPLAERRACHLHGGHAPPHHAVGRGNSLRRACPRRFAPSDRTGIPGSRVPEAGMDSVRNEA